MDKKLKEKISKLPQKHKRAIHGLFEKLSDSIDLLYEMATHDEKTGLYNNKFFDNILDMEIEKAKRGKQKLTICIIDIDHFKKLNDTYGHIVGDDILKKLADVLKNSIRKSDIAARFGGEEFILLFPETSIAKARKLIKRIRSKIKKDSFLKKYNLTVSGGIAEFKKTDTKRKLKQRVDKRLYKAKNAGRDRFCCS